MDFIYNGESHLLQQLQMQQVQEKEAKGNKFNRKYAAEKSCSMLSQSGAGEWEVLSMNIYFIVVLSNRYASGLYVAESN